MGDGVFVDNKLDIIMATHNNLGMTIRAVSALYENTNVDFRLTVVDDSVDMTPDYFRQLRVNNLQYIRPFDESYEVIPKKITHGNQIINIGLKHTTSPHVVYMGNSTIVEPNWLNMALALIQQNENLGLVGFKLLKPTGVIEHAGIYFAEGAPHHMNRGVGESSHSLTLIDDVDGHKLVGWALVLIRRKAIPRKGLEEGYYHGFRGYDDLDNCRQMVKNGWDIAYCGFGVAYHYALATRGEYSEKAAQEYEDNRVRFIKRWGEVKREQSPPNSV